MKYPLLTSLLLCLVLFIPLVNAQEKGDLLDVTVEDIKGNIIAGLKTENFRLFIDGKPQEIKSVDIENKPVTIGWLMDVSRSMQFSQFNSNYNRINLNREAILNFLENSREDNEYFMVMFGQKISLSDFMNHAKIIGVVREDSNFSSQKGNTKLYDAVKLAVENLLRAKYQKQILFLLTDGQDNMSTTSFNDLKQLIKEKSLVIYVLGLNDPAVIANSMLTDQAKSIMEELAEVSGGQSFFTSKLDEAKKFASQIASKIQNQYRIDFVMPPNKSDKWQKLEIKLELTKSEKKTIKRANLRYRKIYTPVSEKVLNN